MSAHDPYSPKTRVGPHRVYMEAPPDPAEQVPGHPDDILAFLREPGADYAERARRVDLVEEVEYARPGRMRSLILTAVEWNRDVITSVAEDTDESWEVAMRNALAAAGNVQDAPPAEAPTEDAGSGTADEAPSDQPDDRQPDEETADDDTDEQPHDRYTAADVPSGAADVIAWIQAAADESDAAARSQAGWLAELARPEIRKTVRAEIDKHLE